jgi:hypothetical protein
MLLSSYRRFLWTKSNKKSTISSGFLLPDKLIAILSVREPLIVPDHNLRVVTASLRLFQKKGCQLA